MTFLELPHIGFVVAAYAAALLVLILLAGAILWDHASLRRALAAYETKGAGTEGRLE